MLLRRCFWYFFRFFSLEIFLVALCLALQAKLEFLCTDNISLFGQRPIYRIISFFSLALLYKQAQIPCIYKMSLLSRYLLIGNISFFSRLASQASSHPQHVYNITLFCLKTQPPPLKRIW